jgi:hypothetical protein
MASSKPNPDAALGRRLRRWITLFARRPDIEVIRCDLGAPTKLRVKGLPRALTAIHQAMNGVTLAWRLPGEEHVHRLAIPPLAEDETPYAEPPHHGLFFGDIADRVSQWRTLDELSAELKAYVVGLDGGRPANVLFTDANYGHSGHCGAVTRYFTDGAKACFTNNRFAKDAHSKRAVDALKAASRDLKKKTEKRSALVERGLERDEADDMIDWLGAYVRFLLPK